MNMAFIRWCNARRIFIRKYLVSALYRLGWQQKFLHLRRPGLALLKGEGVEIGAFEHPSLVPHACRVRYADVITPEQAVRQYPEIDASRLVAIDYLLDLDVDGLAQIATGSLDFVIACHVIEHVANPGRLVAEMIRVVKVGGHVVIAAPDRDYTFDRLRKETPLSTLETYFRYGRSPIGPEDYREMIEANHPELRDADPAVVEGALRGLHDRREHLSVWTAAGFREFLLAAFGWCGAVMVPCYEVESDRNHFEYFGVWHRES
ncbi:MAG: methyltransferase domain-containing protein [Opitutaceae bacterium]|jgi:SAM-dependent methyltransferase